MTSHTPWRRVLAVAVLLLPASASADTLWFQGAEGGYAGITDGTSSGYDLIQSSLVAQGDFAFHLANPLSSTEWFVVDPPVSPLADSSLYFLSRLGTATSSQVATVQVSTNAGSNWSTVYSQPGLGATGEGAFSQRSVDLSGYAGQDISLRFALQHTSGSYYPQSTPGVGWYVDSLQIGDSAQKVQYSMGDISDKEQLMLEVINRARADAVLEAQRLAATTDPQILSAMNQYGITPQEVINDFNADIAAGNIDRYAQPLVIQPTLQQMAELHTLDLYQNAFQGHVSSQNPPSPFQDGDTLGMRADRLGGYNGGLGENVYSYSKSVEHAHAGFDIDWGNPVPGHRYNLHNNDFKEVGIGIIDGSNRGVGPMLITEDFGNPGDVAYVTGVVYEDTNDNSFYDIGEGLPGVQIDVDGSPYYAVSSASGGYAVPVTADGAYEVTFSGDGWRTYTTSATVSDLWSVKVDYLAIADAGLAGDFNNDGRVDAADYTVWRDGLGTTYTQAQYNDWRDNYGLVQPTPEAGQAPEPAALLLLLGVAAAWVARRHRWQALESSL